jgi:small-conductance mechanosensitive channel
MKTLDNVLVSVPNQELLKTEIDNYGKRKTVRRSCTATIGFEHNYDEVKKILLEAAKKTKGVMKDPSPFVWITNFQNYAVEYKLYVFTNDIKDIPEIDADLYQSVLKTCKKHKIDLSTPTLYKKVK